MARFAYCLLLLLAYGAVCTASAQLQKRSELTVVDTAGVARAASQVSAGGNILFVLTDPSGRLADGIRVTLTEEHSKKTLARTTDEGRAVFCKVPSGTWTVRSSVDRVVFKDVQIEAQQRNGDLAVDCGAFGGKTTYADQVGIGAAGSAAGALLGVSVVGGATTAAVVGYNNRRDSSSSRIPLSPSR